MTESENGIFNAILRGQVDFSSDPWPSISPQAKDLVKKMLNSDPKQRLTAAQVLSKPSTNKSITIYQCKVMFLIFLLFAIVKTIHGSRRMERHQMFLLTMR